MVSLQLTRWVHFPSSRLEKRTMKVNWAFVAVIARIAGCNGNKVTGPKQNDPTHINRYLDSLPPWSEFSPLLPEQDPAATGRGPSSAWAPRHTRCT